MREAADQTPRPDCLLHIGHSKTGSSSIQNVMANGRRQLAAAGVYYPARPGWSNHALVPASVAPPPLRESGVHPAFWGGIAPEARVAAFRAEFDAEMAALPPGTRLVVLSSEQCIHMLPDVASVQRLRDLLAPYFATVRIVIYLRRQDTHVASAYTQHLRDGVIATPRLPDGGPKELPIYDYAGLLWRWAKVFGTDAIVPRLFDRSELVGGDAVDDFLSLCGLAEGSIAPEGKWRDSNPSVDADGQALMVAVGGLFEQAVGRPAELANPVWRHFTDLVTDALPGRGWTPPADAARLFVARFAEGNEWIRQQWFPQRPTLFGDAFEPGSPPLGAGPEMLERALALLAQFARISLETSVAHLLDVAALQAKNGSDDAAIRELNRAIGLDETSPHVRLRLADHLLRKGNPRLAMVHLTVAAAALPDDDSELLRLTALLEERVPARQVR